MLRVFAVFCLLFFIAGGLYAEPLRLRAVACIDGDTFVGSKDSRVVRMWGVDAPELDQPWGEASKAALIALTNHRQLNIEQKGTNWGRMVGIARRGKVDIGLELIKMGLAWHDPKYAPKCKEYAEAEAAARKEKRGLWSDDKPVAPWEWRKQQNDDAADDD